MGILDDAIRQHLDLKRRQGADDDELSRLEDEAFGPPSRPGDPDFPEPQGEAEPESGERVASGDSVATEEPEQAAPELAEPEPEPPSEPELETPLEPAEPDSGELPQAGQPIESLDTVEHHFDGALPDTGETEVAEPPAPEDTGEGEIVEGEIADEVERSDDEDEDVLDQTPEFLRDQPEDDELWFEQGEPKDFDF